MASKRLRFTDAQRRRLAEKAKRLGRKVLNDIASIVAPDTLMAWHRKPDHAFHERMRLWNEGNSLDPFYLKNAQIANQR